jgi:hypothetical protein
MPDTPFSRLRGLLQNYVESTVATVGRQTGELIGAIKDGTDADIALRSRMADFFSEDRRENIPDFLQEALGVVEGEGGVALDFAFPALGAVSRARLLRQLDKAPEERATKLLDHDVFKGVGPAGEDIHHFRWQGVDGEDLIAQLDVDGPLARINWVGPKHSSPKSKLEEGSVAMKEAMADMLSKLPDVREAKFFRVSGMSKHTLKAGRTTEIRP